MISHLSVAAPRFILRLLLIDRLLNTYTDEKTEGLIACEIGPGLGDVASYLVSRLDIARMELFDSSSKARDILSSRFATHDTIQVHEGFASNGEQFDLLLCFEVIEHVEEDAEFLGNICSSLKPGGHLIGSVPAYQSKWQAVDDLAGHYKRYASDEMRTILAETGFTDIRVETYGFPLINLLFPLRQFYYSHQLRQQTSGNKAAATARSGVARGICRLFNTRLVYIICRVFDLFQKMPAKAPLDDGLVFICRKK